MEELTPGQASVLVRNEQAVDKAAEELEELEEALCESISESIRGRRQQADKQATDKQAGRKKKRCERRPF